MGTLASLTWLPLTCVFYRPSNPFTWGFQDLPLYQLVSHIVSDKLPVSIRREISYRVDNNYPSLKQLFENYCDAIGALTVAKQAQYTIQNRSHGKEQAFAPNFRYHEKDEAAL